MLCWYTMKIHLLRLQHMLVERLYQHLEVQNTWSLLMVHCLLYKICRIILSTRPLLHVVCQTTQTFWLHLLLWILCCFPHAIICMLHHLPFSSGVQQRVEAWCSIECESWSRVWAEATKFQAWYCWGGIGSTTIACIITFSLFLVPSSPSVCIVQYLIRM